MKRERSTLIFDVPHGLIIINLISIFWAISHNMSKRITAVFARAYDIPLYTRIYIDFR